MKALGIIILMAIAFAGGVWANESYDIGSDPASRISDIVGSLGSPGIESVDAAKTELRDLEESTNREAESLANVAFFAGFSDRALRQACSGNRSLLRDYKRMVELMRFIDENDPSAAPVTVTSNISSISQPQIFTAAELEDTIADLELDLDTVC